MDRQARALVLRRIPYGDTSLVLHVFSREAGRIGLMAKGVRRPGGRLDPVLQTGQLVELQFLHREGRELQILKDADALDDFRGLRRDYVRLLSGLLICEVLERTQLPEHPEPRLFDAAVQALELAAGPAPRPQNLVYWFVLFLLTHSGYGLDLDTCARCGRPWEEFQGRGGAGLDPREGRLRCPDCRPEGGETGLPPALWRVLRFLTGRSPEEIARREITPATRALLRGLLETLLRAHLSPTLELKALRQLDEMETDETTREGHGQDG